MADARIELEIGDLKFVAEGSEGWVDNKYQAFLERVGKLRTSVPSSSGTDETKESVEENDSKEPVVPLAIFLKTKNVGANQNNRFLAAAMWLKRKGNTEVKTGDVVKALADAQQQRLGNPADILNQNVKKGYCVKTSDGFYITPEGEESLR